MKLNENKTENPLKNLRGSNSSFPFNAYENNYPPQVKKGGERPFCTENTICVRLPLSFSQTTGRQRGKKLQAIKNSNYNEVENEQFCLGD